SACSRWTHNSGTGCTRGLMPKPPRYSPTTWQRIPSSSSACRQRCASWGRLAVASRMISSPNRSGIVISIQGRRLGWLITIGSFMLPAVKFGPQNADLIGCLESEPHTVSFPFALRAAQAQQPDAVLLDISMPGMDGYQVARKLRAMFRDKPLLL